MKQSAADAVFSARLPLEGDGSSGTYRYSYRTHVQQHTRKERTVLLLVFVVLVLLVVAIRH